METLTPCPYTVTVRRNPHRRARPTPSIAAAAAAAAADHQPPSAIRSFPIEDILSMDLSKSSVDNEVPESLKVFLRIRPLGPRQSPMKSNGAQNRISRGKNAWPQVRGAAKEKKQKKRGEVCVRVNDSQSVTLTPPQALQDLKRTKSEVFGGFSYVFPAESSQDEVYEKMVNPLVEDFLKGRSGMLAALGPSGSGKTHTVFGGHREPGMVSLALRKIFERDDNESQSSRLFYISMFEINSEGGKAERLIDLSHEGADLSLQQATMKGLQEVTVSELAQAESLIARGMLKRATSKTNLNSQSSRSQCIINIRFAYNKIAGEEVRQNSAVLTIVDLAGSEKEKRTGHQGTRLLESNFINNTSMVLGLCLRSLLEHQKNPKKPLQKHFQNSLLTRYLRDYLEGKKRMALILTVKSGEEDYLDTSFLLRQASPYMKIKFVNVDQQPNLLFNKRSPSVCPRMEQPKRIKPSEFVTSKDEGNNVANEDLSYEEGSSHISFTCNKGVIKQLTKTEPSKASDGASHVIPCINCKEKERSSQIMQNFAKALWKVLKQYKEKLEAAENEVRSLSGSLRNEKKQNFELERELRNVKLSCFHYNVASVEDSSDKLNNYIVSPALKGHASANVDELNAELKDLKSKHSSFKELYAETSTAELVNKFESRFSGSPELMGHGSANINELNAELQELRSGNSSCEELLVEAASVRLDKDSESTFCGSPGKAGHGSADVYKPNTGLKDLKHRYSLSEEVSTETLTVKMDYKSKSRLCGSLHDSAKVHELDAGAKNLKSIQLSGEVLPAEALTVKMDCKSKSRYRESAQLQGHGSANVHVPNAEFEDLKSGHSSRGKLYMETSFVKLNNDLECRLRGSPGPKGENSASVHEETLVQQLKPEELKQDVGHNPACSSTAAQESEVRSNSFNKHINVEKPKRMLLAASSILVRGIKDFYAEVETEKPKQNAELKDLKSKHSYFEELYEETSTAKLDNKFESGFCGSPELKGDNSANINELNAELGELKSSNSSCEDLLVEAPSVKLDKDSGSTLYGSAGHTGYDSADVHKLNAEANDLKSNRSSCEALSLEALTIELDCKSNSRFRGSRQLKGHNLGNACKLNAELEDLKSGHTSCGKLSTETSFVEMHNDSESRLCGSPGPKEECSANVHELNATLEHLKSGDSSPEELEHSKSGDSSPEELEHSKSGDSSPEELSVGTSLVELGTDSSFSKPTVSSSETLHVEEDKGTLVQQVKPEVPKQNVGYIPDCSSTVAQESKVKSNSSNKHTNGGKLKRRLLPASSILVRGISDFDLEDETEKPKGNRGEKKLTADDRKRTQGSISLLRLLKSNLQR